MPVPESHTLSEEESIHAIKVLRKRVGDEILGFDGKGKLYDLRIANVQGKLCEVDIIKEEFVPRPYKEDLILGIAPPKSNERIATLVEKLTEIGIDEIHFLKSDRSERKEVNFNRVQRVVLAAAKQCGSAYLPKFGPMIDFLDWTEKCNTEGRYICHLPFSEEPKYLGSEVDGSKSNTILIGPEGDFSADELSVAKKFGFKSASLGPQVLRTETAGIVACTLARSKSLS